MAVDLQAIKTRLTSLAQEMDLVSVLQAIVAALIVFVIIRGIHYLVGEPPSPSTEWVGSVLGASLTSSTIPRKRASGVR
jgi:hypothetical protein